ncbi:PKD domain-containing protein [Fulvivirgaceae bacterium BMA12]|uniref:PKD domain-containing protein n=1 Tax=Agaribacillus aureus TaxID=3051825 RepID=A0ABT8LDA8_9BACT|nr:PKD domain-containing protein [Fulvivirgaceae bacterium BMA12]
MSRLNKFTLPCIIILYIGVLVQPAQGQTIYTSGSYNSNSMTRGTAIPINHFTGVPNISIPLFSLPGRALSVPISLSYHAGGHKVKDIANWVGLGWNLQVGGVITRTVRGIPDEVSNGYCGTNEKGSLAGDNLTADVTNYNYISYVQSGTWDGQPDDFHFNVMGLSGRFSLDENGVAYTIPTSNIKIEPGICSGTEWVITDEAGMRYIFANTSSSKEESTVKYMGSVVSTHTTAWYLTKIETPNQTEEITFTYQSGGSQTTGNTQSVSYAHMAGDDDRTCLDFNDYDRTDYITVDTKVISSITSSLGSVSFILSSDRRLDLWSGYSLSRIEVFDNASNYIRSFWLNYGYFYSDSFVPNDRNTRRLKLESVYDDGRLITSFDYNETVNLPSRESNGTDHWGFYGNNPSVLFPEFNHPVYGNFGGSDRSTNHTRVTANLISKITYGSGASVQFTFESNQYYDQGASINKYAGGARVSQIISNPGIGQPAQTTTFEYNDFTNSSRSSGVLYAEPLYYEGIVTGATGSTANDVIIKRYTQPIGFLTGQQGVRIGYSNVAVVTGLGKTKYTFRDLDTPQNNNHELWIDSGGPVLNRIITKTANAFNGIMSINVPYTEGWGSGLMEKREIVKPDGTPVVTETFEYDLNSQTLKTLYGVVAEKRHFSNCGQDGLVAASYSIEVKPILMIKKKVTQYNPNNTSIATTDVTEYDYTVDVNGLLQNQFDILLSSTKSYNESYAGLKYLTYFLYPGDYSPGASTPTGVLGGIFELWNRNIRTTPIETYQVVDDNGTQTLNGVSYRTFQKTGSVGNEKVYPHRRYRSLKRIPAANYTPSHNSGGPPEEFVPGNVDFELINTSSYIENSGLIDTQTAFGGTTTDFNYNGLGLLASTSTTNSQLIRNTSTSSNAFTGPTSSTDVNNRNTSFTYDKKQRLSTVTDHENNIVEGRTYVNGNTVAVLIDGPGNTEINSAVTFYASDPFCYGTTTFNWDLDDGSTYSTTSRSVNHTYTVEGVKVVTVTATNTEANFSVTGSRGINVEYVSPTIPPLSVGGIISNTVTSSSCSTTLTFSVSASGSCNSNYVYDWSRRYQGGAWESFDPTVATGVLHSFDTNLEVRVTVTNPSCGNESETKTLQLFFNGCMGPPSDN